jgi:uncharacterized membrane protein YhfC
LRFGTVISFLLSLLVQVGFPFALALYYRRRTRASWHVFAYGVLVFAAFQLFTWLPISIYLDATVSPRLGSGWPAFFWMMALAFTTSLVEEVGRWCGYRYLFPRGGFRLTWRNGIMYGLGQGSLETVILIAGLTFVYFVAYLILSNVDLNALMQALGSEADASLREQIAAIVNTSWEQPLIVALERVLAMVHQIAWALLVMQTIIQRQKRWLGFAVLYHLSIAVIVPGLARLAGFGLAEAANVLLALVSVWIILKLREAFPTVER